MTTTIQVLSQGKRPAPQHVKAQTIMIGSLMSNQLALPQPGVEPIHAMLEQDDTGSWRLTDLGTLSGVKVNGEKVVIEATVKPGDVVEIGSAKFTVSAWKEPVRRVVPTLFGTRAHKSQLKEGRTLEVVAYWGNTVLNVDHFAPDIKGFSEVTIGDPTKAHFISGGNDVFDSRVLAEVDEHCCTLKLEQNMQARVRKDGEIQCIGGVKRLKLGPRDYAHVEYGAVRYFLHYANHPKVELPVDKRRDQVMQTLGAVGLLAYFAMVMVALLVKPKPLVVEQEVWEPVPPNDPRRTHVIVMEPFKTEPMPKPKKPDQVKPVKPTQQKKPPIKVVVKPEIKPVVKPAVKPVVTPVKIAVATQPKNPSPNPLTVTQPSIKLGGSGQPSGQQQPVKLIGSNSGPGSKQTDMGQLKGQTKFNKPGVEGSTTSAPSTTNLSKVGGLFGKVMDKTGGTHVDFRDSPGGTGAKMGSGLKDLGPGGPGGKSMDYAGNGNLKGWGNGNTHGPLGTGGPNPFGTGNGPGDGNGVGPGFGGHKQAAIDASVPPEFVGTPTISPDEIMRIIRQNLNQIRHCYEQALQRAPKTEGRMKVSFTIGNDGRVQVVYVLDSSIDDLMMRSCVTGKIKRWAFPRLPAGAVPVQVSYPFLFRPM